MSGWSLSARVHLRLSLRGFGMMDEAFGQQCAERHCYRFIFTFVWEEATPCGPPLRALLHSVILFVCMPAQTYSVFTLSVPYGQWLPCASRASVEIFHCLLARCVHSPRCSLLIPLLSGVHLFNIHSNALQVVQSCLSPCLHCATVSTDVREECVYVFWRRFRI